MATHTRDLARALIEANLNVDPSYTDHLGNKYDGLDTEADLRCELMADVLRDQAGARPDWDVLGAILQHAYVSTAVNSYDEEKVANLAHFLDTDPLVVACLEGRSLRKEESTEVGDVPFGDAPTTGS